MANYFCQKCGYSAGHTVPDDWKPKEAPTVAELEELRAYYTEPGVKRERRGTVWVTTYS